jgi:Putative phage serine protease XkdF
MPIDVNADTIRIRQRDPSAFEQDSFRTISLTAGVKAVIGRLHGQTTTTTTIQTYLFDRGKFTEAQAEAWVKDHRPAGKRASASSEVRFSAAISKIDSEQHMVWGYASTTDLDSQGDRISLQAMMDALDEYMEFANIREMHQPSAVGKAKEAVVDDVGLYIGAKIVDEVAWQKVKEGVYSAFSVAGFEKGRVEDWIVALKLSEISLVDRPANPRAVIDVWKLGGMNHHGGEEMTFNLQKWGGPENGTDEAIAKALDDRDVAVTKVNAEKRALVEQIDALNKQIKDLRNNSTEVTVLQAKIEKLETDISERDEKEQAERMKKLLDNAGAAGKFKAGNRPHWEKVFKEAGEATCSKLLADQPVIVPIGQRVGSGADGEVKSAMQRFEELADQIMKDEKVSIDKAYNIASRRDPKLKAERDKESLRSSQRVGMALVGGGTAEDEE